MNVIVAEDELDAYRQIMAEYLRSDVVLGELLATIEIRGLSVESVIWVYKKLRRDIDGIKVKEVMD